MRVKVCRGVSVSLVLAAAEYKYQTALWRMSAYIDIYALWSVKRPVGSKPSSLAAARESGT